MPERLYAFYTKIFGALALDDASGFEIRLANQTKLRFDKSERPWYYHFAFNIAENQIEQALKFVKKRFSILPEPDTGHEIIDFRSWNAHSIYFLDPANNIVEFIARHELHTHRPGHFDIDSILEISEIGTPCVDVQKTFTMLHEKCGLDRYSGNFETFCATGDEHGLFILKEKSGAWFPTDLELLLAPYRITTQSLNGTHSLKFDAGLLQSIVP